MIGDLALWAAIAACFLIFYRFIKAHIAGPVAEQAVTEESLMLPFFDYKGVIHCHSVYSDGAATFPELIDDANQLGLDFLITCDHNTIKPVLDGWEGWHGQTLILAGEEVSVDAGHLLVFNLGRKMPECNSQAAINYANQYDALSFLAHPYNLKGAWKNWGATGYTGLEIVNFVSMSRRKAIQFMGIFSLILFLLCPSRLEHILFNNRPHRELKKWDELTRVRKVVGIGGVDAHGFLKIGKKKYRWPRYYEILQAVNTHLLLPEKFSRDDKRAKALVYEALTRGHAYVSFDLLAPADGFQFTAFSGNAVALMGDHIDLDEDKPVKLAVSLPPGRKGIITLLRNGKVITKCHGSSLQSVVTLPGAYRVEVFGYQAKLPGGFYYRKQPWIFSNPIYVG